MKKIKLSLLGIALVVLTLVGCKEETTTTPTGPTKTIVQLAQANPNLTILVQAVVKAGYVDLLNGTDQYTVFAPTDAAFANLLTELSIPSLDSIPVPLLQSVLQYHVVSGKVLSSSLTNNQVVSPLLTGATFTINLTGGAKITDANARVANITATDIEATNGVVHVIDKVILPPL